MLALRQKRIFDHARTTGILLVIVFHVHFGLVKILPPEQFDHLARLGSGPAAIFWQALGSELIFVIAGFLLTLTLLKDRDRVGQFDLRRYFLNRAIRLLPLYWLAIMIYQLLFVPEQDWFTMVANVFMFSRVLELRTIVPVGWSMEAQVQFYLLLPFLLMVLLLSRRPLAWTAVLFVAAVAYRISAVFADGALLDTILHDLAAGNRKINALEANLYYLLQFRISAFLAGVFGAIAFHRYSVAGMTPRVRPAFMWTALLCIGVSSFLPTHADNAVTTFLRSHPTMNGLWLGVQRPLFDVGAMLLVWNLLWMRHGQEGVSPGLLERVSMKISRSIYPLYLFHFPLLAIAAAIAFMTTSKADITSVNGIQYIVFIVLSIVISVAVAWLLYTKVELPLISYLKRRMGTA